MGIARKLLAAAAAAAATTTATSRRRVHVRSSSIYRQPLFCDLKKNSRFGQRNFSSLLQWQPALSRRSYATSSSSSQAEGDDVDDDEDEFPLQAKDKAMETVSTNLVTSIIADSRQGLQPAQTFRKWQQIKGNQLSRPLMDITISKLVRKGQPYAALAVCEWMLKTKPVEIKDSDKFLHIAVACKAPEFEKIHSLLDALEPAEKTDKVYENLVRAYASKDMVEEAEKALKEISKPSKAQVFNQMILMYVRLNRHEKVSEMYGEMKKMGVEASFHTYHILLRFEEHLGDYREEVREKAKAKLESLMAETTNVSRPIKEKMLTMHGFLGDVEGAEKVWEMLGKHKLREYRTERMGIQVFEMLGEVEKVEGIFRESKDPKKLHHHMIRFYAALEGNLQRAEELLMEGAERRCHSHFSYVIDGYLRKKEEEEAFRVLKVAMEKSSDCRSMEMYGEMVKVMNAYAEKGDFKGGEKLMKLCVKHKCVKDAQLYNELLRCYCNSEVRVKGMRERMSNVAVLPDDQTQHLLEQIEGFRRKPKYSSSSSSSSSSAAAATAE